MSSRVRSFAVALLASTVFAVPALAGTFSAAELTQDNQLLGQFNLVTLGNLTQSSSATSTTIQGRALVGGNATFTGNAPSVCTTNCAGNTTSAVDSSGATFGALTVFGNVVSPTTNSIGGTGYVAIGAGALDVKGTIAGNYLMNTNGGTTGAVNVVGSASGSNVGNATAIKTSQSSFAGGNYTYSALTGLVTGNGPTPQVNQSVASVFPFTTAYQTEAKNLAQGIANLPGTPGVTAQSLPKNNATFFTANADYTATIGGVTYKYGVVTTTLADLASGTGAGGVSNGTNDATFVIVRGDGANYTLPNLNSYTGSNKVIYDFVDATTLKFAGNWNGSILAPLATITQQGGTINGSVVVASINQSNALNDSGLFGGNLGGLAGLSTSVPEPASLALLGLGALAAGVATRRRRR